MKKTILIILGVCAAVVVLVALAGMFKFNHLANQPGYDVDGNKTTTEEDASDPKNTTYIIDGKEVTLIDGLSEKSAAPDSASKVTTQYFGNELQTDLNNDGREDIVFLLTQNTGGSGTFFYVVTALNTEEGWVGSQATFIGDRIAPQTTEVSRNPNHKNVIVVNYVDRAPDEPMTISPSQAKSLYLKLDPESMQFGEVAADFEGEANPDVMTLDMKPWTWVKTTYNNDTEFVPNNTDAFVLTFQDSGSFSATTDCNAMSGTYEVVDNKITFGPIASTKMFCEGSQEQDFAAVLTEAQSFFFTSRGELIFELKFDSGSAVFR